MTHTCPTCGATDQDDLCPCRDCGRPMCWACGSMPEGICNDCAKEME